MKKYVIQNLIIVIFLSIVQAFGIIPISEIRYGDEPTTPLEMLCHIAVTKNLSRGSSQELNAGRNSACVMAAGDHVLKLHTPNVYDPAFTSIIKRTSDVFAMGIGSEHYGDSEISMSVMPTVEFIRYGKHMVEVMQRARGTSLFKLFIKDKSSASPLFYATGKALATIHKKFVQNIDDSVHAWVGQIHGDFHPNNIFIAHENNGEIHVGIIDSETSAESIKTPAPLICDVMHCIITTLFAVQAYQEKNVTYKDTLFHAYIVCMQSFLQGYVESFASNRRLELCAYISEKIQKWMHVAVGLCHEDVAEIRMQRIYQNFYLSGLIDKKRPPVKYPSVYCKQEQGLWKGFVDSLQGKDEASYLPMRIQLMLMCASCRNYLTQLMI